jgi:hypothetical protein
MSEDRQAAPFFVGYLPVPKALRGWLLAVAAGLAMLFAAIGWAIATSQSDPGPGAFRFDLGEQTVTGVMESRPYPLLHVTVGSDAVPAGHTLTLAGAGKTGAAGQAAPLDGKLAQISGIILKRGDLDMLQLRGGSGAVEAEGEAPAIPVTQLGRWRLAGEICDGKCLAGAMRPGTGLAHKACANLCLAGGIPPVFVSSQPVEGSEFLLLAGPDGGPLPGWLYDRTAVFLSIEGDIERRGDLLIFRVNPASLEVL